MLKVALIPPSRFGHGACDGCEKVFRPTILVQIGRLRRWSYMSDHDNVSIRQSHIEMKIELAFAAGMSMSFDRSVQHDFILSYATFYRTLFGLPTRRYWRAATVFSFSTKRRGSRTAFEVRHSVEAQAMGQGLLTLLLLACQARL